MYLNSKPWCMTDMMSISQGYLPMNQAILYYMAVSELGHGFKAGLYGCTKTDDCTYVYDHEL